MTDIQVKLEPTQYYNQPYIPPSSPQSYTTTITNPYQFGVMAAMAMHQRQLLTNTTPLPPSLPMFTYHPMFNNVSMCIPLPLPLTSSSTSTSSNPPSTADIPSLLPMIQSPSTLIQTNTNTNAFYANEKQQQQFLKLPELTNEHMHMPSIVDDKLHTPPNILLPILNGVQPQVWSPVVPALPITETFSNVCTNGGMISAPVFEPICVMDDIDGDSKKKMRVDEGNELKLSSTNAGNILPSFLMNPFSFPLSPNCQALATAIPVRNPSLTSRKKEHKHHHHHRSQRNIHEIPPDLLNMSVANLNALLNNSFNKNPTKNHHMPRIEEKKLKKKVKKKYHTTYNKHNSDLRKKLKNMQKNANIIANNTANVSTIVYNPTTTSDVKIVNSARICAAVAADMNNNTRRRKHNKHFLRKSITADTIFITGSAAIANNNKRRRLNGSAGIKKNIRDKKKTFKKNKFHTHTNSHKNLGTNIPTSSGVKIDIAYSQQFPQIGFPFIFTPDAIDNKKFQCKFVVSGGCNESTTANVIFCDHKFGQKCHWMRHCLEKHVPLEMSQRYECKYCTMKYAQNSSLKEHVAICHSEKPPSFRCPYCSSADITFTRWTSVLRHCRNQHSKCIEPEKPVESDGEEYKNDEYANIKYVGRKGRINNGLRVGKRRKSVNKKCEQKHKRYDNSQMLSVNQMASVGENGNVVYSGVRVGGRVRSVLCEDVDMVDANGRCIANQ